MIIGLLNLNNDQTETETFGYAYISLQKYKEDSKVARYVARVIFRVVDCWQWWVDGEPAG